MIKGRFLFISSAIAGVLTLSGCVNYQKDNGQSCKTDLFPTSLIGAAMGLSNTYCTSRTAESTAEEAKAATNQVSDWTDTTLSEYRSAKSAKANGWSDQVADSAASAKQAARTTREFSDNVQKLAEWAKYYAPKDPKTKDILAYAEKSNSLAITAENAAAKAVALSNK